MKFALAPLMMALALAGPVSAQTTRAALTQDRDQPGRNAFRAEGSCVFVSQICTAHVVPVVPSGKRLIVTYLSMQGSLMPTVTPILELRAGGWLKAFPKPVLVGNYNGQTRSLWVVSDAIFATAEAGEQFSMQTFSGIDGDTWRVVMSGYLIDLP